MADLRINRWSEKSLKCNPIWIKLFYTSGEESILASDCSGGFETRLYVHSSFAIIMMGKRELVTLLSLSSCCLMMVVWLFLVVPWVLSSVCDCGIF